MEKTGKIEEGYCQCGCGKKTNLSPNNNNILGYKKRQPYKYLSGHNPKRSGSNHPMYKGGRRCHSDGYVQILTYNHPNAIKNYIFEHILIAEKALGKYLPQKAVVHHHSQDQLVICQDQAYHMILHMREKAFKECGHVNWLRCPYCKQYDKPENLVVYRRISRKDSYAKYHKECVRQYISENRRSKK